MCGIAGFFALDGDTPQGSIATLDAMCKAIAHRGPDDQGTRLAGPAGLGMRRLSIVDLASGQQPMANEDDSVWVTFNGEIYNHESLRGPLEARGHHFRTRSDTEAIVHLYEEHGLDFVQHLNGMFAIALWDMRRERLVIARDRLGEKPLYYAKIGTELIWGSELKCLLAHPAIAPQLSLSALSHYLLYEYVPAPESILEGVHKLPPGHLLIAEHGEIRVVPYWTLDLSLNRPVPSEAEALAELEHRLDQAVRMRLMADVPLGVFLSGGIDSSTVAALAARAGKIETFAIGFEDPSFDESAHARAVAKHLGASHHEEILSPESMITLVPELAEKLDEPFADASILPTYLLSRFARRHVTVALGGDGGDELFAGYPTYLAARLAGHFDALPAPLRAIAASAGRGFAQALPVNTRNLSLDFKLKRFTGALDRPAVERHALWLGSFSPEQQQGLLRAEVRAAIAGGDVYSPSRSRWETSAGWDLMARHLHLDATTYLPDDILTKVDRASMAASLEVRAPFLDHTLVEFIAGLPSDYKLKGRTSKYLLKRAAADLLPASILQRPKKGFGIPVARWFKGELRSLMLDVLSADRLRAGGIFEPQAVETLIREHLDGRHDHRKPLWTLFMFELWREAYLVRPAAARVR